MLDWHLCQICYPLEIKLLLLLEFLGETRIMIKIILIIIIRAGTLVSHSFNFN